MVPWVWVQWDGRTNGLEVAGGDTEAPADPADPADPATPAAVAAEVLVIVMKTAGEKKGKCVSGQKRRQEVNCIYCLSMIHTSFMMRSCTLWYKYEGILCRLFM